MLGIEVFAVKHNKKYQQLIFLIDIHKSCLCDAVALVFDS